MKIAAGVDWSQFEENGQFTENSRLEFMKHADDYFDAMNESKPAIQIGICGIKGRINEKLQEHTQKAYEAVAAITQAEEYMEVAQYDYELKCFLTAVKIYQRESGLASSVFDGLEYTEHFLEIYRQMLFYFRRLQLHLAKPLQQECIRYMREKKLSIYAVAQMLQDCEIGGKEEIALSLADLFQEQNMTDEAGYLLSDIASYGRPEWQERIDRKKMVFL